MTCYCRKLKNIFLVKIRSYKWFWYQIPWSIFDHNCVDFLSHWLSTKPKVTATSDILLLLGRPCRVIISSIHLTRIYWGSSVSWLYVHNTKLWSTVVACKELVAYQEKKTKSMNGYNTEWCIFTTSSTSFRSTWMSTENRYRTESKEDLEVFLVEVMLELKFENG